MVFGLILSRSESSAMVEIFLSHADIAEAQHTHKELPEMSLVLTIVDPQFQQAGDVSTRRSSSRWPRSDSSNAFVSLSGSVRRFDLDSVAIDLKFDTSGF